MKAYRELKDSIYVRVCDLKKLPKNVPHRTMAGLSLYCYSDEVGMITSQMVHDFVVTPERVYYRALKHTRDEYPEVFMPLSEALGIDDPYPIYILTNDKAYYGAAVIFYAKVLEDVHKKLCDDYYAIPSSVHEVLIIPEHLSISVDALKAINKEVNASMNEKDILSKEIYHYSLEDGLTVCK